MHINFRNRVQEVLWHVEITGQLSDGMWENSRPYDHYQPWCDATTSVLPTYVGHTRAWIRKDSYALTSRELLGIIGERMCFAANLAFNNPTMSEGVIREYMDYQQPRNSDLKEKYWLDKHSKMLSTFGSYAALDAQRRSGPYGLDMKELIKELQDIKKIMKTVIED